MHGPQENKRQIREKGNRVFTELVTTYLRGRMGRRLPVKTPDGCTEEPPRGRRTSRSKGVIIEESCTSNPKKERDRLKGMKKRT